MKRLSLAATLCLLVILSAGLTVTAKETWTSVRSKNFLLVGNASEKEIRQVAVRLEQFREVASRLFIKANFNSPVPTTVIVFKNDSSYRPFKPNANAAGYFQAGPDVNYITLKTEVNDDQNPFGVIFHEYTHLLIDNTNGNVPTWFNEGLAEYYSTFSITDDRKVVLGRPIANHVYLLRENKMLPLRTLFKVDQESAYYNERDKQSIFYAESWALMHYLIGNNKGERLEQLGKFMQLLETNMAMEQAFQQAFQTSFENMEKGLREYIKRDSYPVTTGHFEDKLALDTEMQAAPISEAEAQAYLGDLLLHSHRPEAEGYLQKALALDPKLAMANAAMGMLRVREGKIDEARQSLERAVAENSQNYLIHYYYAFALSREGMNQMRLVSAYQPETAVKIREELKKAIDLRPDYPESYNLLAFINLVTETQLDESITLLKKVLATSPGRNDLLFTLAQVYLRQQDFKTARQILERLSQNNGDQRLRQQALGMIKELASMEEQMARAEAEPNSPNGAEAPRRVGSTKAEADAPPPDPSSYLQDALRPPAEGEKRVQGSLVRIDCDAKGITFVIKIDDRLVKLHTDKFQNVQMVAFSADAGMEVTCGPRKSESSVIICYLPPSDPKAKFEGTIKSIEFVPKEFKLKT
jgi:predicted Zn-dependent protease